MGIYIIINHNVNGRQFQATTGATRIDDDDDFRIAWNCLMSVLISIILHDASKKKQ